MIHFKRATEGLCPSVISSRRRLRLIREATNFIFDTLSNWFFPRLMPFLAFNLNDGNEFVFDLLEDRLSIGRDSKNDIVIDNSFISGFHAEFLRQEDGSYEVVDLKSSNGTYVNGKRVVQARVKGGDKVSFGQLAARYKDDGNRAPLGKAGNGGGNGASPRKDGKRGDTDAVPVQGPLTITPTTGDDISTETAKVDPVTKAPTARPEPATPESSTAAPSISTPTHPLPPPGRAIPTPPPPPSVDVVAASKARLAEVEREILDRQSRVIALRSEVDALEKRKSEAEAAFASVASAKRELSVLQESIETAQKLLSDVQSQSESAKVVAESFAKDEADSRQKMDGILSQVAKAEAQLSKLKEESAAKESEVAALSEQQKRIAEAVAKAAEADEKCSKLEAEVAQLEKARAELESATSAASQKQLSLQNQIGESEARAAQLAREISERETELQRKSEEEKHLQTVSRSLTEASTQQSMLAAAIAALVGDRQTKEAELQATTLRLAETSQAIADAESRLASLSAAAQEEELRLAELKAGGERLNEVSRSLAEIESNRVQVETTLTVLLRSQEQKQTEMAQLVSAVDARRLELESLNQTRETEAARMKQMAADREQADARFATLQSEESALQSRVSELNRIAQETEARRANAKAQDESIAALSLQLEQGRVELAHLQKENASLVDAGNQLRAALTDADKAFSSRSSEIDASIKSKSEELRSIDSCYEELRLKETVLLRRLDDLALEDSRLGEANAALKIVEEQKEKVAEELAAIMQQLQERGSELAQLSESGTAQRLLVQTIGRQKIEAEKTVAEITTQREAAEQRKRDVDARLKEAKILCDAREEAVKRAEVKLESLNDEFSRTEEQRARSTEQLGFLTTHIEEGKKSLDDLANATAERDQQIKSAFEQLAENEEKLKGLQSQIALANTTLEEKAGTLEKLKEAEARIQALAPEIAQLNAKKAEAEAGLEGLKGKSVSARSELDALTKTIEEKRQEIVSAEALFAQHESGWRDLQLKSGPLESLVLQLAARQSESESKIHAAESELSEKKGEIDSASSHLASLAAEIAASGAAKDRLVAEIDSITEQRNHHQTELNRLTEQGSAQRNLIETLNAKRVTLEEEIGKLELGKIEALEKLSLIELNHSGVVANLTAAEQRGALLSTEEAELEQRKIALAGEIESSQVELSSVRAEITKAAEEKVEKDSILAALKQALVAAEIELEKGKTKQQETESKLADLSAEIGEGQREIGRLSGDKQRLESELTGLGAQRDQLSQTLEAIQGETEVARQALAALKAQSTDFEKTAGERQVTLDQDLAAKAEQLSGLELKLSEAQSNHDQRVRKSVELESEIAAKAARITEVEELISDLAIKRGQAETELASVISSLGESKSKRQAEEEALGVTLQQHQRITAEIEGLQKTVEAEQGRVQKLLSQSEEAANRVSQSESEILQAEARKVEIEGAIAALKLEQGGFESRLPGLNSELLTVTAALAAVVSQRDEASNLLTQFQRDGEISRQQIGEFSNRISELQKLIGSEESRFQEAKATAEEAEGRVRATATKFESSQAALDELVKRIEASQQRVAETERKISETKADAEARSARLEQLKREEAALTLSVENLQARADALEAERVAKQAKIKAAEAQFIEVTQTGGRLMSMSEALSSVEQRNEETARSLKKASEEELSLQVKISTLLDNQNRELARLEQIKKSRVAAEEEGLISADEIRKRIGALEKAESEAAQNLDKVELRLGQLARIESEGTKSVQTLQAELAAMEARKADFALAETKMRQWQDIEKRLQGQLAELEEKHEVMRMGLTTDESTVLMFATDLIKRLDLIDVLIQRFSEGGNAALAQQLTTLRASFEDILHQHGVTEFEVAPGTVVDVALRYKIAITDSVPGKSKPKVIESYRPGYIYSSPEGKETILRKVEVKTSSQ